MPRWIWFLPLALLVLTGAISAFRLGWIAANMTESDAIDAYVGRYLDAAGPDAQPTDCMARPGLTVWLVLECRRGRSRWTFWINRFGGLVREEPPGPSLRDAADSEAPRT